MSKKINYNGKRLGVGIAALALCFSLTSAPVSANHNGYSSGKSAFKQSVRDYGRKVGRGANNYYQRNKSRAGKFATKKSLQRLGRSALKRNAIGAVVDSAWPNCAGENC